MAMITNDWLDSVSAEFKKPYYRDLYDFVKKEYSTHVVYPPADDIFNALHLTPLSEVKVLILGQDPYHNEHQAHGLSFSVLPDQKEIPPSLQNIYKELQDDLGCYIPDNGYLEKWAKQGVLLLNTVLTVRAHQANSHQGKDGSIYGCHYPGGQCPGSTSCLYAVGQTGTEQNSDAYQSEASDIKSTSSKPAFGIPWFLRMQTFLTGECIFRRAWSGIDRLAD